MSISLDQRSETLYNLLLLNVQVEHYQNILKLRCWPYAFTSFKAFLNSQKWSGTSILTRFLHDFWKKIFLALYSITWPNCIVLLPLLETLGNMCIVIICFPVYDAINFKINLSFLSKPFFYITKTVRTKIEIS